MSKVLDFDKFMSEKEHETIDVTVYGKVYKVKCFIPAIVPVTMARAENSSDPQAAVKMIMIAADSIFGKEAVDELCAKGMSGSEMTELINRLFKLINGFVDENEDDSEQLTDEDSRKTARIGKNSKK